MSDPATGRFISIDPLAEEFYFNSTYAFSENRVIDGVELEGLERVDYRNLMNGGAKKISSAFERIVSNKTYGAANRKMETSKTTNPQQRIDIAQRGKDETLNSFKQLNQGVTDVTKGGTVVVGENLKEAGKVVQDVGYTLAPFTEGTSLVLVPVGGGMQVAGSGMQVTVYAMDGDDKAVLSETLSVARSATIGKATEKISKPISDGVGDNVGKALEPLINRAVDWITNILSD